MLWNRMYVCESDMKELTYHDFKKLESKLKMMEIAFEQINNSRNDMIRQLAELELSMKNQVDLKKLIEKKVNYYVKQMNRVEYQWHVQMIDEFIHELREILVALRYERK